MRNPTFKAVESDLDEEQRKILATIGEPFVSLQKGLRADNSQPTNGDDTSDGKSLLERFRAAKLAEIKAANSDETIAWELGYKLLSMLKGIEREHEVGKSRRVAAGRDLAARAIACQDEIQSRL